MTLQYLMTVPAKLVAAVMTGSAIVDGAVVKGAATGQVLAHLQPSGKLAMLLSGGPVGAVVGVVDAASSIGANVQLEQVKNMLATLQVVAGVGAAASILNLGVSVGGFALVLNRLKKLDEHISVVEGKVSALREFMDRVQLAKMLTALDRCEHAFLHNEVDRERVWRDEERQLDESVHLALREIEALAGKDERGRVKLWERTDLTAEQVAERISIPMMCVQVRLEALLLLKSPEAAHRVAENARLWLEKLDLDPERYVKAHRGRVPLGLDEITIAMKEATGLNTVLERARLQAKGRVALCDAIVRNSNIDSRKLVEEIRDYPEPDLLMLKVADLE